MSESQLPPLPHKRYFSIGEVAELCEVKPHVLRYWEQEFSEIQPVKRRGSRRYYQAKDVELIRLIRHLLYDKGFTINGARQALRDKAGHAPAAQPASKFDLTPLIEELEAMVQALEEAV
ncbi:MAG: transcriptional regulator [Gammaproteobacteria bacterium CG11_big_fil_rev_8_21_14_0_20_46_22]|nr:MAG: transcriptional regulator [Gammaproteobacteria bacterium CG12_big_fil_rev_8_21_14_0_65_46_12]PIR11567.1 MAG: transcriptional regulator [Gammaproteobacteria bacterium CG11_big_fil_rev_8_21_14_0_20_46_22]